MEPAKDVPVRPMARRTSLWSLAIGVLAMVLWAGVAAAGPATSKVDPALMDLYGAHADHAFQKSAEPFVPRDSSIRVIDDRVVVDVVADGDVATLEAELVALGMRNVAVFGRMISGELPVSAIPALDAIATLRSARPARARRKSGAINSQGDLAMRADVARTAFGVTGAGVKVGVLSDSFNCLNGAAANVAANELSPVTVIQEISGCADGTDEGRAMLQIVHDVAPGATLLFATAFNGTASFASNILALRNNGAHIILDDIAYNDEPMFQDGPIAQAIDTVVSQGAAFFSASCNDAHRSYESVFRAGTTFANGAFPSAGGAPHFFGGTAHNFAPSGAAVHMQRITIGAGRTLQIVLQWDSPFFSVSGPPGSPNDLDVYLLNSAGTQVVAGAATGNTGDDALEIFTFTNSGATANFNLMIVSFQGPPPGFIKYAQVGGPGITIATFDTASGTVWGHPAANGAAAVGAAFYGDTPVFGVAPPVLESYSSGGPVQIFFDTAGNRLPTPAIRAKPQFVAPDGVQTTVLNPFFGTSAAAPHAAGVAALMLQQRPGLSPSALYSALQSTAVDMGPPGFDLDNGSGLIQADGALQAVSTPSITLGLSLSRHTVAAGDAVQVALSIANSGTSALQDFYFVILVPPVLSASLGCPAGDAAGFFTTGFASTVVRCVNTASPQTFPTLASRVAIPASLPTTMLPTFFSFVWPAGLPAGSYAFTILTSPPGAVGDGVVGAGDITALATDAFNTSP